MEFKIEDLALSLNAEVVRKVTQEEMIIKIGDKEHTLQILCCSTNEIDFMLDNSYHHVKYMHVNSADMRLEVDGNPVTVSQFAELRAIAQKSSGVQSASSAQRFLTSSIPGRVVSVVAKPDAEVKKGDVIVVLESMKMQVAIKAHKDGTVKELKVKEGSSISRNDIVALIE
ncbi:MAG: acetyl-CoA carboxylase biotin carboxyl carrier protein subunit [Nitrososphaerales archaeon]